MRLKLRRLDDPHGIVTETLNRVLPVTFLETTPPGQLTELTRYLEAARLRAEKARRDPPPATASAPKTSSDSNDASPRSLAPTPRSRAPALGP